MATDKWKECGLDPLDGDTTSKAPAPRVDMRDAGLDVSSRPAMKKANRPAGPAELARSIERLRRLVSDLEEKITKAREPAGRARRAPVGEGQTVWVRGVSCEVVKMVDRDHALVEYGPGDQAVHHLDMLKDA